MYACKTPKAVYAGQDALNQLPALLSGVKKAVVFSDRGIEKSGVLDKPLQLMQSAGVEYALLTDLPAEPTYHQAQATVEAFRAAQGEVIVAIGGGSVMDAAKLCSILADGRWSVKDLLDDPSRGRKTVRSVMIPTTAGTGAEATPNAIVAVPEKELKVGIVCEEMIPDAVILDGEMIARLPAHIAASTGVDALCHAVECYTSKKATPFSNLYAMEALKLIIPNIEKACLDPEAIESKNAMLLAAYYAGVAITCSGTTAVHALSYPLGGKYHIPHGVANAMMLMPVMHFNFDCIRAELAQVHDALGQTAAETEADKARWTLERMEEIVRTLKIPTDLKAYGVPAEDLEGLVKAGMDVQRLLVNNKRTVTAEDARKLYLELLA
ncbi:MAG: iron-containing alcohol dehydrogenase [Clostridia bacterium]|nr:iron-containing alcohol dehydrogenase [Clostridia bacterium]